MKQNRRTTKIQKTLFGEEILLEYIGLNYKGDLIKIPNFQPTNIDDNPRLDLENKGTKGDKNEK